MISLKNVLLVNGISSGATGLLLIAFGNTVASLFGVQGPTPIWSVGIFLIAFAALVISEGLKKIANPGRVWLIIVLDGLWVLTSAAIVLLQLFGLSVMGYAAIVAVGAWVALMAFLQAKTVRQVA